MFVKELKTKIKMKYLILFLFQISAFCAFAQQNYGSPEERARQMTAEMHRAMQFEKAQKDSIYRLNLKYARRIQKEVIDRQLNVWRQYNQVKKINKLKEKELFPLLSETQRIAYEALKKEKTKELWKRFGL